MPSSPPETDLLAPADAARILGLSADMVRILAHNGQLTTAAKTVRGARLFRREDVEELAAARAGQVVRRHSVQFYADEEQLVRVLAAFVLEGVRTGAAAIVLATPDHRAALSTALGAAGIDVAAVTASGQLIVADAEEALTRVLDGGRVGEARFGTELAALVERTRAAWPRGRLRVYGELVELLWRRGDRAEALALEACWNRLAERVPFSLLCAYCLDDFAAAGDGAELERVCEAHNRVLAAEPRDPVDRGRQLARLQQRARALENELAERVRVEQALRLAQADLARHQAELEEALRAKQDILAMLGHELRNPLAPILSSVELLRMRSAQTREHVIIERQVRHLHRLVEDLLDVGRLTRGQLELARTPIEIAAVIAQAASQAGDPIDQRRADLDLTGCRPGLLVEADPARLAQALGHLLRNAAQNSPRGTPITVDAERHGDQLVVRVRDRGVGIDAALLPRVFELFVQDPQPLDRARGGLGIGLAIAKNVVELHGGSLRAHSEGIGMGSEFVVTLPVQPHKTNDAPAGDADRSGEPRRILIVDDNQDAATMLGELLSAAGHVVEVCLGATAALQQAPGFAPHLVLCDIGLPDLDGHELARRLRPLLPTARLVAVSGYGDGETKARSAQAGFEAHLVKPVRLQEVLGLAAGR